MPSTCIYIVQIDPIVKVLEIASWLLLALFANISDPFFSLVSWNGIYWLHFVCHILQYIKWFKFWKSVPSTSRRETSVFWYSAILEYLRWRKDALYILKKGRVTLAIYFKRSLCFSSCVLLISLSLKLSLNFLLLLHCLFGISRIGHWLLMSIYFFQGWSALNYRIVCTRTCE